MKTKGSVCLRTRLSPQCAREYRPEWRLGQCQGGVHGLEHIGDDACTRLSTFNTGAALVRNLGSGYSKMLSKAIEC